MLMVLSVERLTAEDEHRRQKEVVLEAGVIP